MKEIAIRAENISKIFRIYDHPIDRLKDAFSVFGKSYCTEFQALDNLSFTVAKGEFLGIVGKNGAGKSTLLKILSGELTPTNGSLLIDGKVSLLQLGVGFDPELSGNENAIFASKLLGYCDSEIEGMLEEIAAFADIGDFMNHPVKTYSSGMYSRLSFAVGININPDILIADEVLAVGDMRFSQRCLRKMRDFKDEGKTVIFVTHDIGSVNIFCDSAMWIRDGRIFSRGDPQKVTGDFENFMLYDKLPEEYEPVPASKIDSVESNTLFASKAQLDQTNSNELPMMLTEPLAVAHAAEQHFPKITWNDLKKLPSIGDGRAKIRRMAFLHADSMDAIKITNGFEDVILLMEVESYVEINMPQIGFVIYDSMGLPAIHTNNDICMKPIARIGGKKEFVGEFRFRLPSLRVGSYILSIGIQTDLEMAHKIDDVYEFKVARADLKGTQCGHTIIENQKFELFFS